MAIYFKDENTENANFALSLSSWERKSKNKKIPKKRAQSSPVFYLDEVEGAELSPWVLRLSRESVGLEAVVQFTLLRRQQQT